MSAYDGTRGARAMSLGECQAALAAAQHEAAELRDKYLRASAAIENTRKQADRNAAQRITERLRGFNARLLEVADNLERALSHAPEGSPLRPGLQATLQQLFTALEREGVTPIPVSVGDAFDPNYHEAVAAETADVAGDTIAAVTQTGYIFEGQVLRPARVIVARPAEH